MLQALNNKDSIPDDRLCCLTKTKDGKILKSTTVYLRDEAGEAIGIFSINYDITLMLALEDALRQFTATVPDSTDQVPEPACQNVCGLLDELIEQSVKRVGKPVALMSKEDKVKAIGFLNDSAHFSSPNPETRCVSISGCPNTPCTAILRRPKARDSGKWANRTPGGEEKAFILMS